LTNTVYAFTPTVSSPAQTETTITLSWTKSNDLIFGNYAVTYSTSVNGPYSTVATITDSSQTSYAVTGLNPSTPYYFIIKDTANNIIGSSTSSSQVYQAYTVATPQISSPSKTSTTVSLHWSDYNSYSSTMPFQSYVIQMSVSGGQWSTLTSITDVSQNTYTVTGLSPATYEFLMYDKVGTSGLYQSSSNIVTVYIYPIVQVQINNPSTTTVDMGQQVQLSASASGGTNSYSYQWYLNGNPISGATSASYTYSPTDAGTSSTIYVTAQDTQDSSLAIATSNTVTLTTPLTANFQSTIPSTPTPSPTQTSNSNDTIIYVVVIVVVIIAVIGAVAGIVVKQKASKKP